VGDLVANVTESAIRTSTWILVNVWGLQKKIPDRRDISGVCEVLVATTQPADEEVAP
jgi:hypothetical protein